MIDRDHDNPRAPQGLQRMTSGSGKLYIYEINTWVWLHELSQQYQRPVTLSDVPDEALDALAELNIDYIWMMGVWKRSEYARLNALKYKHEYVAALPDIEDEDVIGSAYSIAAYEVEPRIGGREGLAQFRQKLRERGLKLILDFVPNHIAIDHPWVDEHPDFIVQGSAKDARSRPGDFFRHQTSDQRAMIFAHGRDPYFPGWSDTAQLNVFNPELREALLETLLDVASQCDGVRCDMAMLVMNEIFRNTWNGYVADPPETDFWPFMIPQVKARYSEFIMIAEVYWGREYDMLQQGFDFTYDKTLYDRIMEVDVQKVHAHLTAPIEFQQHMVRFIENHDEPRAHDRLGPARSLPAATLICTLPGACLLHHGQLTGAQVKLPVQIRRGPIETQREDLRQHYLKLLQETHTPIYRLGEWRLFELAPVAKDDITVYNLLAYGWRLDGEYRLIVVNLTSITSYARLPLKGWEEVAGHDWILHDIDDGSTYVRRGSEMITPGLFIELNPFEAHIFRFQRKD